MRTKTVTPAVARPDLESLRVFTRLINEHQDRIAELSRQRRALVMSLREKTDDRPPVTYWALAEAMHVSEQAVHKIISKTDRLGGDDESSQPPRLWRLDDQTVAAVVSGQAWKTFVQAGFPDLAADMSAAAQEILGRRLNLLGVTWESEEECRSRVFANHAGGLPADVAEVLVLAAGGLLGSQ